MPSRNEVMGSIAHASSASLPDVAPVAVPAPILTAPPSTGNATATLMNLMMLNMLQQQQAAMMAKPQHPMTPLPSASDSAPAFAAAPASGSFAIPDVSLDDFCARYNVELKDKARLEKMEFRPGDNLDVLGPEEWKVFGGFMALSWARIKDKNQAFLRDVQLGVWKDFDNGF